MRYLKIWFISTNHLNNNSRTSIPPQKYNSKITVNIVLPHFYERQLGDNIDENVQ